MEQAMNNPRSPISNPLLFWRRKFIISVDVQVRVNTPISKILKTFLIKYHFSTFCIPFIPIGEHPVAVNRVLMQGPNSGRNNHKRSVDVEESFRIVKYTNGVESMLQHI